MIECKKGKFIKHQKTHKKKMYRNKKRGLDENKNPREANKGKG